MPQRKSGDAEMSRKQIESQGVNINDLMAESGASTKLGNRTVDMLADLTAKGEITHDELKAILQARASLPEVMGN